MAIALFLAFFIGLGILIYFSVEGNPFSKKHSLDLLSLKDNLVLQVVKVNTFFQVYKSEAFENVLEFVIITKLREGTENNPLTIKDFKFEWVRNRGIKGTKVQYSKISELTSSEIEKLSNIVNNLNIEIKNEKGDMLSYEFMNYLIDTEKEVISENTSDEKVDSLIEEVIKESETTETKETNEIKPKKPRKKKPKKDNKDTEKE